ncbi:MAG TPA: sialidase family protein, partial [Candidatus Acidoferrales bacterium]
MRKNSLFLWLLLVAAPVRGQVWQSLGPPGGDVRTLATDPTRAARIFLGTADGHIFGSEDSASHWTLLGRASSRHDAVITAIVVDSRDGNVLYASSWARDSGAAGGVFRSTDGGHTWSSAGLAGQSVRALAMAPSDPNVLVAGTLDGVYRSLDASRTWQRISPEHHEELRNLDSLAIDPHDPQIIYA